MSSLKPFGKTLVRVASAAMAVAAFALPSAALAGQSGSHTPAAKDPLAKPGALHQQVIRTDGAHELYNGEHFSERRVMLSAYGAYGESLEFELKLQPLPFDGLKTKVVPMTGGEYGQVYYDLREAPAGSADDYRWRVRVIDPTDPTRVSPWTEIFKGANPSFTRAGKPTWELREDAIVNLTGVEALAEGDATARRRVRLSAIVRSEMPMRVEIELKKKPLAFDGLKTKTGKKVTYGRSYAYWDLINVPAGQQHDYGWRARLLDKAGNVVIDWTEFGAAGNTDFSRIAGADDGGHVGHDHGPGKDEEDCEDDGGGSSPE